MTPLEAMQATLAGEHAATYVLSVLGAQTSQSSQPDLYKTIKACYRSHRSQRDRLGSMISTAGGEPVAADASYALPNDAATPAHVRQAAQQVEARCSDLYGQLVENSTGATRAWAITALAAGARREVGFGLRPTDFPGMTA